MRKERRGLFTTTLEIVSGLFDGKKGVKKIKAESLNKQADIITFEKDGTMKEIKISEQSEDRANSS